MVLDPLSTFFWYSVVIFGGCAILALIAEFIDGRNERRARWEARDKQRRSRVQPGPTVGEDHGGSPLSDVPSTFSLRQWHS